MGWAVAAPDVLEAAVRRAVEAWAEAVYGDGARLRALASPDAVRRLLHPCSGSLKSRLVVRGPRVRQIRIVALDAGVEPATMTIAIYLRGRRYLEDRDTTEVLSGNPARATSFTEHWTMALDGPESAPWRLADPAARCPLRHQRQMAGPPPTSSRQ